MSLTDEAKNNIKVFYSAISAGVDGFKSRHGQRQMIAEIAKTIGNHGDDESDDEEGNGSNICVIEGRTGVGKTVGYLVPAIVMAAHLKKKLILSSATVALQEQLINRDIPMLLSHYTSGDEIKYVIAKGRNRYVCPKKLSGLTGEKVTDDLFSALWDRPPQKNEVEILSTLSSELSSGWNGDRDDLGFAIDDKIWNRTTNDSFGCAGKNCSSFEACPYMQARDKIRKANIIVSNHDWLLTSLRSASMTLPDLADCIVVFDEAHHVPDITIRRLSATHKVHASIVMLEKFDNFLKKVVGILGDKIDIKSAQSGSTRLHTSLDELQTAVYRSKLFATSKIYRYVNGQLDFSMAQMAESIEKSSKDLQDAASQLLDQAEALRGHEDVPTELSNNLQTNLGSFISKIGDIADTWCLFSADTNQKPLAKWLEESESDFSVTASELHAGELLQKILWSKAYSVVLTSATVTTLGQFSFFLDSTGLTKYPNVKTLAVQSPFNFRDQGQIFLPRMRNTPKNQEAHTQEVIEMLPGLLSGYKGTLVLFSSKKQMLHVYDSMKDMGMASTILIQGGDHTKREIIRLHTSNIANGLTSTIFGLAGFGEGVDLPGELCSQVIITKIPFAPPDSPIEMSMSEWIDSNGGNSFNEMCLPKAALKLTQWVGRLIRSESDTGRVVFLDSRMYNSSYKQKLLASLPDFSIVRS